MSNTTKKSTGRFSLFVVSPTSTENRIDGNWTQDVYGTLELAKTRATATEMANDNKIKVVVTEGDASSVPNYETQMDLKVL